FLSQTSCWSRRFDEWDEDLTRRLQRSRRGRENSFPIESQSFTHNISQPIADTMEARCWLKQAESDLEAMLHLNQIEGMQCQVLFQGHEACEKALKAGMYKLVGLNPANLKTHGLLVHAYAIAGMKEGDWAKLPSLVSSMEQYYLKTRYPNQHNPSVAPVDIYCCDTRSNEVQRLVNSAKKLVALIKKLF
uniref:HEPN domain-containing protein n=1 Tax=Amphimedon queenslandica TaxID=400682 RepID=A0A1X7SV36_AMPQE